MKKNYTVHSTLMVIIILLGSCVSEKAGVQKPCECEFMSIAAIVQLVTGRALQKDELSALFKTNF